MFRIRIAALGVLALALSGLAPQAYAQTRDRVTVSLVVNDTDSATAIAAVKTLRSDPRLAAFDFRVFPARAISQGKGDALAGSRLAFVQTVGRGLASSIAPQIKQLREAGGMAFAVGPSWDASIEDTGLIRNKDLSDYAVVGGPVNFARMVRRGVSETFGLGLVSEPVDILPEIGAIDFATNRIAKDFEAFRTLSGKANDSRPWVGLAFYRSNLVSGQLETVKALTAALDRRGFNVVPFFGFPNEKTLEAFAFDRLEQPALHAVGALSLKISNNPATLGPLLSRLDAPIVNLITLNSLSADQWSASPQGMDILERSWQLGNAEYGGLTAPTIVASKETVRDEETGIDGVREMPIPERLARAADRIAALAALRTKPNAEKRIALLYYNYPPGRDTIGASYLNVLPSSLQTIAKALTKAGYKVTGLPDADHLQDLVKDNGGNVMAWGSHSLDALVRQGVAAGTVQLLPVSTYEEWLRSDVPAALRDAMNAKWGTPQASRVMVWNDRWGRRYFVFPVFRFGNIVMSPQPSRGWEQNIESLYHDTSLPPHHQYLAFYLWLQREFRADAVIHLGTHATHEWLSGKEVGLSGGDPGDLIVGAIPQFYPYIVDDVGEALQAKRRGMATIISHMIPPLDKASLNPQLKEIAQLLSDYTIALGKSPLVAEGLLKQIQEKAAAQGLLKDLGLQSMASPDAIEQLDDHIRTVSERATPFGLHTFGASPDPSAARNSAETLAGPSATAEQVDTLYARIMASGGEELNALVRGLDGHYVPAGPGNDPLRTPESLPTGRNLYGFDPTRLPTQAAWAIGERLASDMVADYRQRKGQWPTKYVFNLWGVESTRHEGVMEAQIMTLLGIRPVWDTRGRISGLKAVPRAELSRPRIDVTIIPSGLYRDLFPVAIKLLDEAVTLARQEDEADNAVRNDHAIMRRELIAQGVAPERAEQLAGLRIFSVPSGAYGTNLDKAIPLSNTYGKGQEADRQLSGLFFMRMHHAFGQGMWGESVSDRPNLGVDLLKGALKGAQGVVHSRSSAVYGALDGDDFYQYLGGTAMAMRAVNGASPEVLVTDMANPNAAKTETLERYMGREMRARYLNPKWIEAMMKEGYAGAAFMHRMVENLYGWQVTVPEAVGDEKWNEIYETWVKDRNNLHIEEMFRKAGNLLAYQAMIDHMLVAINKGYWKATPETVRTLNAMNMRLIDEDGAACDRNSCSSPDVLARAEQKSQRVAQSVQAPAPTDASLEQNVVQNKALDAKEAQQADGEQTVSGFLMEDAKAQTNVPVLFRYFAMLLLVCAFVAGLGSRLVRTA